VQEPVLKIDNIQGNILGEFGRKNHRALIFLKIERLNSFRGWLAANKHAVTSSAQAIAAERAGDPKQPCSWFNIAFSYNALCRLVADADTIADMPFREGLAKRSALLGDPLDPDSEGHPRNWVVGGPDNEADVVLIVADDDHRSLALGIERLKNEFDPIDRRSCPASILYYQLGSSGPRPGHEHFGFRDEISQPRPRGRFSDDPHDFLTPRVPCGETPAETPDQQFVWPGEFLFGYPKQDAERDIDRAGANSLVGSGPKWIEDGSFLVIRRLKQDVYAFHTFLHETGRRFGLAPNLVAAKLLGRWASGAPVGIAPCSDNAGLAASDDMNNDFLFHGSTASIGGDANGERCPISAHIRKVNPRDVRSRTGDKFPNQPDTQTHRLIRRGIPYGEPTASTPGNPIRDFVDRGLLFLAYQTSIQKQFEFIVRRWANETNFPEPLSGHDPIIGQNNRTEGRKRMFRIGPGSEGIVTTDKDWITPTGGGYFFSPAIDSIDILATGS
jgi:Dyp-type peroxidase family